ncbi:MAG: serine/threonine protein kinase, partial [Actinobacteria bacterium]|nr:serine/threonine protein kinase [Actinomycetota bacterium]
MNGGKDDVVARVAPEIDLGIDGLSEPILIGQGGFGAVYRAEQQALGRTVAVKVLSAPGLDDRTRDRFTRECMAIGALSGHPHIVTVFDSGINGWGRPYIVMDYMARGSIADRIAVDGSIPWPEAVDMGIKICGAVATAHAAGVLHRDIKPQNVLISAYGEPKLGDFGISSIGGEQTSSGSITASLEHAAPELLDASPATTATDVYALASTIYTMVAGECPFPRGNDEPIQSLITRIATQTVPDLRPRGVPGALCDVLERALAKSPDDRPSSVEELADSLRKVQEQHGLAPTALIETPAVAGFGLLDRFAPRSTGTTAPTRVRMRNEYVPPAPPPQAAPP